MRIAALIAAAALAACSNTVAGILPGEVVTIDGREYLARRLSDGSWQSLPNAAGNLSAATYAANLRAIEAASGCAPIGQTARSGPNGWTIATVDCP